MTGLRLFRGARRVHWLRLGNKCRLCDRLRRTRSETLNLPACWIRVLIGEGAFGQVYRALLVAEPPSPVAIKTLHAHASKQDKTDFLQEAVTLAQFDHPNVLQLIGVVLVAEPWYLVTEMVQVRPLPAGRRVGLGPNSSPGNARRAHLCVRRTSTACCRADVRRRLTHRLLHSTAISRRSSQPVPQLACR